MNQSGDQTLWVNVPLRGLDIGRFERVKAALGLQHNTEVVRYLVNEKDRELQGADVKTLLGEPSQ